jgi:hypothetical protein
METPTQTMERAKRLIAPTTIKATDLTAPPPPVTTPPPPVQGSIPTQTAGVVQNVSRDLTGLITAQTQEAQRARELAQEMSALGDQGSLSDMFQQERSRLGIDTNLQELKDIQLQLNDMDTGSKLTETRIEGAAGQTMGQAQREVTQEQRENAVRTSGLAARAAVLQGNINTATQLAKDTVNLAFQDRQLKAQNVLNQLNYYQGIVDDQTAQLIEQDKRSYEAELAAIEELKTNISTAMVNGATQAEIGQLNDPNLDDASKLALAQSITARGANEMRGLDIEAQRASIRASNALASQRLNGGDTTVTPSGQQIKVPTFDEWIGLKEEEALMSFGAEKRQSMRAEYEADIQLANQANALSRLSPTAREIVKNPRGYFDLTATRKGEILDELAKNGIDTAQIQNGKKRPLTAGQADDLVQAQIARDGVIGLKKKLDELESTGPIVGGIRRLNPYDPQVVAIMAEITRIVPGLARGIYKEVGVLTDSDVERYIATLANPSATPEQRNQLHEDTMRKVDQSINLVTSTYSDLGYDLGKFDSSKITGGASDGLSDDDAYQEYLRITGQK